MKEKKKDHIKTKKEKQQVQSNKIVTSNKYENKYLKKTEGCRRNKERQ